MIIFYLILLHAKNIMKTVVFVGYICNGIINGFME